jgi:hypothetical protein
MKYIGLLVILIGMLISCKKEGLTAYTEEPRIYFNLLRAELHNTHPNSFANNILVDFSSEPRKVQTDTLLLRVQASGLALDIDNGFNGQVGLDYKILNEQLFIPAGGYDTVVYVVALRQPDMTTEQRTFAFRLEANDYFGLGPLADTLTNNYKRVTEVKIRARDILTKPQNWDTFLANHFGSYSETKYRFMIDVLERSTIPTGTSASTMRGYVSKLTNALNEYNTTHPKPLTDENGDLVEF